MTSSPGTPESGRLFQPPCRCFYFLLHLRLQPQTGLYCPPSRCCPTSLFADPVALALPWDSCVDSSQGSLESLGIYVSGHFAHYHPQHNHQYLSSLPSGYAVMMRLVAARGHWQGTSDSEFRPSLAPPESAPRCLRRRHRHRRRFFLSCFFFSLFFPYHRQH